MSERNVPAQFSNTTSISIQPPRKRERDMRKFRGVSESFALPTCSDMIDPFYNREEIPAFPRGIIFQSNVAPHILAQYRTMQQHVWALGAGLGITDDLFDTFQTLKESVNENSPDN
jgi:hypothetical protein